MALGVQLFKGEAAGRARLRADDVIVMVDGRATRSLRELQAVIGAKDVGDEVMIRVRRGDRYFTRLATLRPLRPRPSGP